MMLPSMLQHVRKISSTFFYHFGIHCATHQIRMILISSVVITSLFYPALAIYSSSFPHTHQPTRSILNPFLAASAVSGFYAQHDLRNLWEGHQALRVVEDAVSRAKCGKQRTLRVERVLIQSPFSENSDSGALNHQILESTLKLEQNIFKVLTSRRLSCLKKPDGQCFVLSPLAFWRHSSSNLRSDPNILDTLGGATNISISDIPITPQMVLAGRGSYDYEQGNKFDYTKFLALTYFFPDLDCLGSGAHPQWLSVVRDAVVKGMDVDVEPQEPTLIAIEYDTRQTRPSHFSAISLFLYLAYFAFFIYVGRSMRDMVAVHSRIGLTFTALVEIAVSTVTSLSVCALVGFRVTMVPWELLPIVIVFVGAENMFSLVDAVTRTAITLPVKQRIALGLSHAGTSNTLKVVSYNAILGTLAFVAGNTGAGAITQFCVFAIVVLVAHWFLAHTFFLAVLSIDIQRLELYELLRQNASLAPALSGHADGVDTTLNSGPSDSRWQKFIFMKRGYFRRRVTKDISLVLLLAITATLYYTTSPASPRPELETNTSSPRGALSRGKNTVNLHSEIAHTPAWHIWKTLNPDEDPMLHLRIEMPTIITFDSDSDSETDHKLKTNRHRLQMGTQRPVLWFLKIVVLPITATTTALYFLCLYLLKDAELLEAQRNRAEPGARDADQETLEHRISFTTMPRAYSTDVELIAASKDGRVIASVGMHNELVIIWPRDHDKQMHISIDTTDVVLRAASTSSAASAITALSMDENGSFCAVGTGAGVIAVWAIQDGRATSLPLLAMEHSSSRIEELLFIPTTITIHLLATYENGTAAKWAIDDIYSAVHLTPVHLGQIIKCMTFRVHSDDRVLVAFAMRDGVLELIEATNSDCILRPDCFLRAGNPSDPVALVSACSVELGGIQHLIIGAATEAGVVSLWDGRTGECVHILEGAYGEISNLRVSPVPSETCRYCGELPLENFTVSFSVGNIVLFCRAYLSVQTRRCSCARGLPRRASLRDIRSGKRSRSNSVASSVGSISASTIRSRLSASTARNHDTASFPVSGHGVHSRRASEKDTLRRTETSTLALVTDQHESSHPIGPLDASLSSHPPHISAAWHNLVVVRLTETSCDRGSWDVLDSKIVGVRRKARSHGQIKCATTRSNLGSPQGLTTAALDRWELWTFDPSSARLRNFPLSALIDKPSTEHYLRTQQTEIARLPFTRVSPFFSLGSFGFGGFGNTVGVFKFFPS